MSAIDLLQKKCQEIKRSALVWVCACIFIACHGCAAQPHIKPEQLTIDENFRNPLGHYNAYPHFSWKLPLNKAIVSQSAYQIQVSTDRHSIPDKADLWDSGKIVSGQSVFINYEGKALKSRLKAYWQVRFWDQDDKPSEWSQIAHFELGLLHQDDWKAEWIRTPDPEKWDSTKFGTLLFRPQYLRKDFQSNSSVQKARLYITAKGVFHAYINAKRIGEDVLTPGWTPYHERVETITYDVAEALKQGGNTIGIILAEGWHSGRIGPRRRWDTLTAPPWAIGQLEIEYSDGRIETITTDKSWRGTTSGPIRSSGIYDGEVYDAHFELPNWNQPGCLDSSWHEVLNQPVDEKPLLFPKRHFTISNQLELKPVSINKMGEGLVMFDLGQNMVGVPQIRIPAIEGDTIVIRTGEMINDDGSLYTGNLRGAPSTNYYIARRDEIVEWKPAFTYQGFRYVEIRGHNKMIQPDDSWVTGLVQYTGFQQTGFFSSSSSQLNQLHSNINWGLRGNFIDIPIDCPQRAERLGWTGDAQVFAPTSFFLADVHAFWAAWLQSMREEQFPNGGLPVVVPNVTGNFAQAGWSDAAVIIPWNVYMRTGQKRVLEENYQMMQKWLKYHASQSNNYISHMSTVGDWLQPYSQQPDERRGDTPHSLISTAFYAYSVKLTKQAAEVLGLSVDYQNLHDLYDSICHAFETEFFDKTGRIKESYTETQTAYLLAIGFDLLSEDIQFKAIPHLVAQIAQAGKHLRTGFLGTPLLARVLDETGHIDLMYEILFKETYPSWFYPINQGATTMWERWDGYTHDNGFARNQLSFNHYAYGAIGQWMYERISGISPLEPGYKKIRLAPMPGGPLTSAKAEYESPYGKIVSDWRIDDGTFYLHVIIPPNTTAEISIPRRGGQQLFVNGLVIDHHHEFEIVDGGKDICTILVPAGAYHFSTEI